MLQISLMISWVWDVGEFVRRVFSMTIAGLNLGLYAWLRVLRNSQFSGRAKYIKITMYYGFPDSFRWNKLWLSKLKKVEVELIFYQIPLISYLTCFLRLFLPICCYRDSKTLLPMIDSTSNSQNSLIESIWVNRILWTVNFRWALPIRTVTG